MKAEQYEGKGETSLDDLSVHDLFSDLVGDYLQWRHQFEGAGHAVGLAEFFDPVLLKRGLRQLSSHFARDYPFHSSRYVGHMLSEVSLPAMLGYFAGMLHNDNIVTPEAGPVGAALEDSACRRVLAMLGYRPAPRLPRRGAPAAAYLAQVERSGYGWAHLTSGGSSANLEALWIARTLRQSCLAISEVCRTRCWPLAARLPGGKAADIRMLSPRDIWFLKPDDAISLFFAFRRLVAGELRQGKQLNVWSILGESGYAPQNGLGQVLRELQPVILVSPAAHYSIAKSANLLGFGQQSIRSIPFDSRMRASARGLEAQLGKLSQDEVPLAVVAIAGTTVDGTVDPVHRFARLRSELELEAGISFWLHVDAAYGGYLRSLLRRPPSSVEGPEPPLVLTRGNFNEHFDFNWTASAAARALRALPLADSITCDNHKLGYNPYPSGLVAFRDDRVRGLIAQRAPYITSSGDCDTWQPARSIRADSNGLTEGTTHEAYGSYTLECSRPGASASALWLATRTIPLNRDGHGRLLAATLRAARELYEWLVRWPEVLAANGQQPAVEFLPIAARPPDSNVVVFAVKPAGCCTLDELNRLTRKLHQRFQISAERGETRHPATQDFWLSKSVYRPSEFPACSLAGFWRCAGLDVSPRSSNRLCYEREGLFALRAAVMNPHCATPAGGTSLMHKLVEALYRSASLNLADHDSAPAGAEDQFACSVTLR